MQIIEPKLVEIVAQRITQKEIQELKKTIQEHENQINRDMSTGAGWQFYVLLGKFSKNKILAKIEDLLLRILIDVESTFNLDVLQTQGEAHRKYNLAAVEGQKKIAELNWRSLMTARLTKLRARDLGLPFDGKPGKFNAITDISGIEIGFTTLVEGEGPVQVGKGPIRTGVTAILPRGKREKPSPIWAGHHNLNGNGEMTGTHWINEAGYFFSPICITNTHSVGMVHHAVVGWMIDQYGSLFQEDHAWAMPVVAETYDGMTNDICGRHVAEAHVLNALNAARPGPVQEGNVGGGTGMMTYEFKGGTGTSSRMINITDKAYTIGVLVQSNFGTRKDFTVLGVPVGKHWPEDAVFTELTGHETGSIIVIIGTDLPLLPIQLRRVAKRAAIGIGRTGTPGGHSSGDIFLAFSTANDVELPGLMSEQPLGYSHHYINDNHFDVIYDAVVQAIEEAVLNAMVAAEPMTTVKPAGYTIEAIDHDRLKAIMIQYNRLKEEA